MAVVCSGRGGLTWRVDGYHVRRLADVPVGGRGVVIELRVRRLVCWALGWARQTFGEQVLPVAERYARRALGLASLLVDVAVVLAGRAGTVILPPLAVSVSPPTVLRLLMAAPAKAGRFRR